MVDPVGRAGILTTKGLPGGGVVALAGLLFLAVIAAFWPVLRNDFITYDDQSYVVQNSHVQNGLSAESIGWAFGTFAQANWHPLTWLSHMLDFGLFGLAPGGHHATSLLLHALNTVLLFLVLLRPTEAAWPAFFTAALFGLHPLHVESVAWVAERKDVLSGLFFFLTLWAYVEYVGQGGGKTKNCREHSPGAKAGRQPMASRGELRSASGTSKGRLLYGLALLCFALGLMSKPMVVTLPFVLLLLDYWPLQRFANPRAERGSGSPPPDRVNTPPLRLLMEKVPFLLLAGGSCVVTLAAQQSGHTVTGLAGLPSGARATNAVVSYCRYLGKALWPVNLVVFYPHPGHWPVSAVLFSTVVLALASVTAWRLRRSQPYLWTGWWWFMGMLVPVIGLVQVGWQSIADRYSYLPLIGIFIALAWAAQAFAGRWRRSGVALAGLAGTVVIACAVLTHQQLGYWKNSGTLFGHAIAVTGENYVACANLGNYAAAVGDLEEATTQYRRVVQLEPDAQAHCNLGAVLYRRGQFDEALKEFEKSLAQEPGYVDAHIGAGTALAATGRLPEARRHLGEAIRLKPDSAVAHAALGYVLAGEGQRAEAVSHFREALKSQPNYPGVREQLQLLSGSGN